MLNKLFILILFFQLQLTVTAQDFLAGAATRTINPEKDSLYLAGGKPNRPFIDVHDNLYVKAVVVSNSNNNITLLTFDCIGLLYPQLLIYTLLQKSRLKSGFFYVKKLVRNEKMLIFKDKI